MDKTESKVLAEVLDQTRKIGKFYMSRLKGTDALQEFDAGGKKLNCVLWILAHITWAEYSLVIKTLNGPKPDVPWLKRFGIGSSSSPQPDWPSLEEVYHGMEVVHRESLKCLNELDDKILDEPAYLHVTDWHTDKRHIIMHAIRHEGIHLGHLSWLCKLHEIKTF